MRPIQASIDLNALRHNLQVVRTLAPKSLVMAVVKANGYGHGLLTVAQGLSKADGFAVLGLNEGTTLREAGFSQTILMLEGVFHPSELQAVSDADISVTVHNEAQVIMLEQAMLRKPVNIFVKMNNGMNRLGFRPEDYAKIIRRLEACRNVRGITLMSHFAMADEISGITEPLKRFQEATRVLDYPISLANSAAILRHPETHVDWVRPGIMLYGANAVSEMPASECDLLPVMTLTSSIIALQTLLPGESVGYGGLYTATKKTRVGVVACGYADGYPRHALTGTPVMVADQMTRIIGRVSMDMLCVDLTDIPDAMVGSSVELWGKRIPVDMVAERAGTIGYELLCALSQRVPIKVLN